MNVIHYMSLKALHEGEINHLILCILRQRDQKHFPQTALPL